MKKITARFNSKCTQTGATIRKGEQMLYDYSSKKCYCQTSETYKKFNSDEEQDARNVSGVIQAQEEAYFDNFYQRNY